MFILSLFFIFLFIFNIISKAHFLDFLDDFSSKNSLDFIDLVDVYPEVLEEYYE